MAEDLPALCGWVAERLDEIFALFPEGIVPPPAGAAYATCIAAAAAEPDPEKARAACRTDLLRNLAGLEPAVKEALNEVLEALEEEINDD